MNRKEMTALTVQIPAALASKLKSMAASMNCAPEKLFELALVSWIAREEEDERLIREALEDVDAGRVVDHSVVQAWADSLDTDNPQSLPL